MKTISKPCAIRLIRNSRINIEKSYLAFHRTSIGKPDTSVVVQNFGFGTLVRLAFAHQANVALVMSCIPFGEM